MRVIAGTARSRALKGPPGAGTRPMTDKVKEALFNILAPFGFEQAQVLDLFAGTGSLGVEALSRGAGHADFVEQNATVCRIIRSNLETTGLAERGKVHQRAVAQFVSSPPRAEGTVVAYDIIFADPPYADPTIPQMLLSVGEAGLLAADGVFVVGHSSRVGLDEQYGLLHRIRHRSYGDSDFSLYQLAAEPPTNKE